MAYEIETKDGIVVRGIPDHVSPDDPSVKMRVQAARAKIQRAEDEKADMRRMADPTTGMSAFERGAAGAGKALTDLYRGGKQLFAGAADFLAPRTPGLSDLVTGRDPSRSAEVDAEIAESRGLDAPLMSTTAGQVGNFAGNVAAAVPTMFIPGANTYTGAALIGSAMGALQPTVGNESRLINTGAGALFGVGGQAAGNLIGRALRPVQSTLAPEAATLAAEAQRRGIPLTAGQATGSRPLQIVESVMENLPLTSGPQLARKQAQQTAFNRAVGATFGAAEDAITPEVAGAARSTISQRFTDLAKRNVLNVSDDLVTKLGEIETNAVRFGTGDISRAVSNRIDDFLSRVDTSGQVSGLAYRRFDSALGRSMRSTSNGDLRHALGEIRDAVRTAMDASISGADQAAWRAARQEYGNLMTVAPLAARNELGNVSGRTLLGAANNANQVARFGAPSELATLGRVGRAFVSEQIPNSGTAQRLLAQGVLTGGGAGVGALGAMATGNDPLQGAALGLGVTAGSLLTPRLIQILMNSKAGQAYLKRGLLSLSREQQLLLNAASRGGAVGLLGYAPE